METKKISQEDINRTVWKACDTFRGVIDPSQYKDYILTGFNCIIDIVKIQHITLRNLIVICFVFKC